MIYSQTILLIYLWCICMNMKPLIIKQLHKLKRFLQKVHNSEPIISNSMAFPFIGELQPDSSKWDNSKIMWHLDDKLVLFHLSLNNYLF